MIRGWGGRTKGGIKEVHLDVLTDCRADFVIDHFPLVALALVAGTAWTYGTNHWGWERSQIPVIFGRSNNSWWWCVGLLHYAPYPTLLNQKNQIVRQFQPVKPNVYMGDFTQGGEWLLKNVPIFSYGKIQTTINISTDGLQPTCSYQLRVSRGPHNAILGHALVELV